MCGIVGVISQKKHIKYADTINMVQALTHRGPDNQSYCYINSRKDIPNFSFHQSNDYKENIFLGHTLLSIQDLSQHAYQPMSDISKNIWITYNGEIYNFKELRTQLIKLGHNFQSSTDTEVIIYAYLEWGINCIKRFNGMFAFALYDNLKKEFYLVRDRYGIKPLYYSINDDGTLLFASESKAILEYKEYDYSLNREALLEYFTFQNIFTDKTLHNNIKLLPAGNYLSINIHNNKNKNFITTKYWDFDFTNTLTLKDDKEYTEELDRLFQQAVKRQSVSNVEIGSYLSGGIDSGLISAIASQYTPNFKTFTIGFDISAASGLELAFDERAQAEFMSSLFKTEHYEMILKAGDMQRCLPKFAYHLEEPRVGQSYPNYYAAKLASKFVKVVFSGTGSDELFAGYPWRYYKAINNTNFDEYINSYYDFWQRLIPNNEISTVFAPIWNDIKDINTKDIFRNVFKQHNQQFTSYEEYINHSLYFESKTFLHGLLVMEDKLSMSQSLETRVPYLDNDLVDFAQQIPLRLKLKNFKNNYMINENTSGNKTNKYYQKTKDGKLILRNVANNYMPDDIVNRPKQGFSSPDASWFKGESIDFVRTRLFNNEAKIYKYMNKSKITQLINKHLTGKENRRLLIWSLLNFEEWSNIYDK